MPEPSPEVLSLLTEIRDLLLPVADAYRDEYERREAQREAARFAEIKALVDSTPKRRAAWKLADGTRSQREIAQQAGLDEGSISKYFKALRELGAVSESTSPTRLVEVK